MYGGPSHVDTFDYKPKLYELDGQTIPVQDLRPRRPAGTKAASSGRSGSSSQYGQCGKWVSDLFPNLATCVDDIAFLHSMTADSPIHGSAMLQMNTGKILSGSPCLGSWVNYGLGSVNENLPGFVVMLDPTGGPISGAKNWSSGYMPATYQGDDPALGRARRSSTCSGRDGMQRADAAPPARHARTSTTPSTTAARADNSNLAARIASYELAFRMQPHAPEAVDLTQETAATPGSSTASTTRRPRTSAGAACWPGGWSSAACASSSSTPAAPTTTTTGTPTATWCSNHTYHAGRTDKPIAGLLKDLKQRGLLDETLVIWGGEFGRQPTAEYATGTGRDHNAYGFTMWMAGGGIKGGVSVGETDELGSAAVSRPLPRQAPARHHPDQMGLDPNRLTYFYGGLNQKLVGVEGAEPIREVIG